MNRCRIWEARTVERLQTNQVLSIHFWGGSCISLFQVTQIFHAKSREGCWRMIFPHQRRDFVVQCWVFGGGKDQTTILWIVRIYPVISFPPGWHHISLASNPYKMTKASVIVTWWMDPMQPTLHDDRFMLGPTGYCDLWFSSRWLRMAMPVCKGIRTLPSRDLHVDFSAKWCVFSLLQQGDVMKILFVFLLSSCPLGIVPLKDTKHQSQFLKVSVPLKYASQKHDRFSGILTETRVFRISTPCLGDGLEIPQNHHLTKTQSL